MYYRQDCSDIARAAAPESRQVDDHPGDYVPDPGLVDAVNVALVLNRPLLLTGDPGTGKTQLAFSVAWQLASRKQLNVATAHVERFEAKSTSVARDLFYSFDTLGRFQAAYSGGKATQHRLHHLQRAGPCIAPGIAENHRVASASAAVRPRRPHAQRGSHRRNRQGAARLPQ